jgi:hypothetical protein
LVPKKGRRQFPKGGGRLIDRLWVPGPRGIAAIEAGAPDHYDLKLVARDVFNERYTWRANVTVPAYDVAHSIRIVLKQFGVDVTVEDWTGAPLKHTFGQDRLCMWYPSDPPERQWQKDDGLLKLLDTAVEHLFKEYYHRETGEWVGEEAPHGPKIAPSATAERTLTAAA